MAKKYHIKTKLTGDEMARLYHDKKHPQGVAQIAITAGVSRARVNQILYSNELFDKLGGFRKVELIAVQCLECDKQEKVLPSASKRKFCSRTCFHNFVVKQKEAFKPIKMAKRRKYAKEFRERHPHRAKEWAGRWAKNNPEKVKAFRKKVYLRDKDKIKSRKAEYYQKNKEKVKARMAANRLKKKTHA